LLIRWFDRDEVSRISKGLADIELNDMKFELRRDIEISSMKANQAIIRDVWSKETVGLAASGFQSDTPTAATSENGGQAQHARWVCGIQERLEKLMVSMKEMEKDQELLLSLWFESISIRHETLAQAHLDTFSWIFRGSTPDHTQPIRFVEWLRGSHSIYWIQGKAGSGKSTLMKFLGQHPETLKHLGFWAGHQEVITARFYFWNSGSSLQKSQLGLLRSLLFEILRQCPKLLAQVRKQISSRKEGSWMWGGDKTATWQYEELLRVYQFVVEQNTDSKFCFFIDGLDEYKTEMDKDHRHLVKTLKLLASSPSIKLCLSSRPWTVFLDAFGASSEWTIKLEDLTNQDIYRYVADKLQEHDQYHRLVKANESYSKLIEEVVRKAQGVFLWVFLVVRDLLEGLTYNDTMRTMYLRLSQFPEDLGSYFQRMIDSIPKFYRRETAQTFRIALAKEEPSLLVTYAFFDDLTENPMLRLEGSRACAPAPSELAAIIQVKHDTMRRRLDGRCKGLIEIVTFRNIDEPIERLRVDFLHRTVRDYLQGSQDILDFIYNEGDSDASFWTSLYRAIFLTMRELRQCGGSPNVGLFSSLWEDLLTFVYKAIRESSNPTIANCILDQALKLGGGRMHHTRLLERACEYGLLQYVQHNLCNLPPIAKTQLAEEVFLHALIPNPISAEFSPDLVSYLLALGADPNKSTASKTNPEFVKAISTSILKPPLSVVSDEPSPSYDTKPASKPLPCTLISSFKEKLNRGQLSLSQKGLSEVVCLLNAKGAGLTLPISTPTRPQIPRRATFRGLTTGCDSRRTPTGISEYSQLRFSRERERKRTYEEENQNEHYPFDTKRSRQEGF
jgi:hypothetical protein